MTQPTSQLIRSPSEMLQFKYVCALGTMRVHGVQKAERRKSSAVAGAVVTTVADAVAIVVSREVATTVAGAVADAVTEFDYIF